MKLSVIIVNYNVEYFLEQCLTSLIPAKQSLDMEVYVVDNRSVDGSMSMVKSKFPWVKLIENDDNIGFSRANNQALRIAEGEYVLLLNPDTVLEEDTLSKCIAFMDDHPDAGGLGVKMLDGKGNFLPESKRGLPTPWVAFYKIFGFSRIFNKSKKFNAYHQGHLDKDQSHSIEILSGAFMMMRKSVLDKIGLLDETFFMYGEDIDLSWRIVQAGYKNYYFSDTRIIHYKGESTKKGSLNYVFVFYNAMIIFAKKHFSQKHAKLFSFLINIAIYLRAFGAVLARFLNRISLPLLDLSLGLALLFGVESAYESYTGINLEDNLVRWAFMAYSLIWLTAIWLYGGYDRPFKFLHPLKGVLAGSALILIAYALLPEEIRFSRAVILLGTVGMILLVALTRLILHLIFPSRFRITEKTKGRFGIVASMLEVERISTLLHQTQKEIALEIPISPNSNYDRTHFNGSIKELNEIIRVHKLDEIIYSAQDNPARQIIASMSEIDDRKTEFKIAPPESMYLIGSNSIESPGDLFMLDVNSVNRPSNRRKKRILDLITGIVLLMLSPILIWLVKDKSGYLGNSIKVIFGYKTWVGYSPNRSEIRLPDLKDGVLHPATHTSKLSQEAVDKMNVVYAKDYSLRQDLSLIWKSIGYLGAH